MTSTFTPNKLYELMATGDHSGTWGTEVNTAVFTVMDLNLGGRFSVSVAGNTNYTVTNSQAQNLYHTLTGALTGPIQYILPNLGGFYFINNNTSGAFNVTVIMPSGAGVVVQQGTTALVFANPDIPSVTIPQNYFSSISLGSPLAVAQGGTGGITAAAAMANLGTAITLTAGTGLTGGGDISTSRTFSLANIASNNLLANLTGGAAAPISNSLTATIDAAIGGVQGNVLFRSSSNWQTLAPGTSGQFLQTQGAGADVTWGSAANASFAIPQFRLSPNSGTPVLYYDVTGALSVYYTPYYGGYVVTWDGTNWTRALQSEVHQDLSDSTKSPSATSANNNYDMFYWLDSGTFSCTRGPAWSVGGGSATTRGTGAGSTDLVQVDGVWMNRQNITNGPVAQRGIYVGTIRTNSTNTLDMMFSPAAASGGTNNNLFVWNYFNRTSITSLSRDSDNSWNYTTATWHAANGSNSNRINVINGMNEDFISVSYAALGGNAGATIASGVGLDVTNAFTGTPGTISAATTGPNGIIGQYRGPVGLGNHFFQAVEYSQAANTTTWFGDNGAPTVTQMGLFLSWRM